MYFDNDYKFIALLNKKKDLPSLMNALGHMAAGLVAQCCAATVESMHFVRYEDAEQGIHSMISKYPFIILSAKNGNQIRSLRQSAIESGIPYTDFVDTMIGRSADEQLQRTACTPESDLEYFGICLFGPAEDLDRLTRRFSLFTRSE